MERVGGLLLSRGKADESQQWYRRAAEAGLVSAMSNLGRSLVHTDLEESLIWLTRAAENGDVKAMKSLAASLEYRDWDGALSWLRRACDSGDEQACHILVAAPSKRPWSTRTPLLVLAAERSEPEERRDMDGDILGSWRLEVLVRGSLRGWTAPPRGWRAQQVRVGSLRCHASRLRSAPAVRSFLWAGGWGKPCRHAQQPARGGADVPGAAADHGAAVVGEDPTPPSVLLRSQPCARGASVCSALVTNSR